MLIYSLRRETLLLHSLCPPGNPDSLLYQAADRWNMGIRTHLPFGARQVPVDGQRVALLKIEEAAPTRLILEAFEKEGITHPETLEVPLEYAVARRSQIVEEGDDIVALGPTWRHEQQGPLVMVIEPNRSDKTTFLSLQTRVVEFPQMTTAKRWKRGTQFIGITL